MKVVELSSENQKKLEEFIKTITDGGTRPAIYIGLDKEGSPVLYTADLNWKELAFIKTSFDMHVTRDWLGMDMQ